MKKKGFTLIELLAVIVILAVIALIATPLIMGTITKAKQNALKDTAYGILKAAGNYQADKILETSGEVKPLIIKNLNTDNTLLYKGQKPTCGYLVIGEGIETIVIANNQAVARKSVDDKEIQVSRGSCTEIKKEIENLGEVVTTNLTSYHNYKSIPVVENGSLVWKDQSGNGNHGVMLGFDESSGYQSDGIHLDGIDDVINLGMQPLDMTQGVTLQLRFKNIKRNTRHSLFGNWEMSGSGLWLEKNGLLNFDVFIDDYVTITYPKTLSEDVFHTITATYDKSMMKLYLDGKLILKKEQTGVVKTSPVRMALGANPGGSTNYFEHSNIIVQSAFIYKRGLTEEEVRHNYLADIINSNS